MTTAADVFGFGMLTAFVIYGAALPFWVPSNRSLFLHNLDAPPPIIAALERCLHNDPVKRPTLQALCNDLRLHWIPRRPEEEVTTRTILLNASDLFAQNSEGVASDVVPSSRTIRPALFAAASADSPLPVAVTLRKTPPTKWQRRAALVAMLLGLVGTIGQVARNYASAQHDAAQQSAAQPLQAISIAPEQPHQTEPDMQPQAFPAPDMATIDRVDLGPVVLPVAPAKQRVKIQRKKPKVTESPSRQNAAKLTSVYVKQALDRAQEEIDRGNFEHAIELARAVAPRNYQGAWRLIGVAACNLTDAKLADAAFNRIDPGARDYIEFICRANGLTLVNGLFRVRK